MRRLAWSVLPLGVSLLCFQGCYGATEILVKIQTDVPCATVRTTGIAIRATGASSALADATLLADSTQCTDGAPGQLNDLGSLVFIPTADAPQISIRVVLGVDRPTDACDATGSGCITADRRLTYEKHRTLHLPIRLDDACTGRVCGDGQTCSAGLCVTSSASCTGTDCGSVESDDAASPPVVTPPPVELDSGVFDAASPIAQDAGRAACEPLACARCAAAGTVCCIVPGAIDCYATASSCREHGVPATQACNGAGCACTDGQTCQSASACGGAGSHLMICGGSCVQQQ